MQPTPEQLELQGLVNRFLADTVTSEYLRSRINSGIRSDSSLINAISQLGIFESFKGEQAPCGVVELGLLGESFGRFLVPEATLEEALFGVLLESFLESASDKDIFQRLISPSAADKGGSIAIAYPSCCDLVVDSSSSPSVTGSVSWCVGASENSDTLIGFVTTEEGLRGCVVKFSNASGRLTETQSLDLTASLSALTLKAAPCALLSAECSAKLLDALLILKASEVVGIVSKVLEVTVEYAKTRKQFGAPIGSFQAISHKLARGYANSEALSSLTRFAAWSFSGSPEQRPLTSRAAILKAAETGVAVCEMAVQCHGGIGFTWEYDLHLYLRRAKVVRAVFDIDAGRAAELVDLV
jgi:hypothetical protein